MAFRVDIGQLRPPKYLPDGRVRVDATISRTGVQVYHDHLGKEIHEYRPDSEVFSQASIDSMQLVVVTDDHPPEFITDENRAQYECGTLLESVRRDGNHLVATLLITDKNLIEKMKRGKRDISMGYSCELVMTPGIAPDGSKYDGVQTNIIGNHAAVVDRGRAGTARARMDGLAYQHVSQSAQAQPISDDQRADASQEITKMEELQKKLGEALAQVAVEKARADAAEKKATETEAARADVVTKLATAQGEARDQKARADEAEAANAKIKTDAAQVSSDAVKARVDLATKAIAILGADAKIKNDKGEDVAILDAEPAQVMRAVVVKVDGEDIDTTLRGDASYVRAMFDSACKRASKSVAATTTVRDTINQNRKPAPKVDEIDEAALRKKLIEDSANAHKAAMSTKEGV